MDTKCLRDCLYDLETDPCEFENKAAENPEVVTKLRNRLTYYENITMSQQRPIADVNADPSRWGGYWSPWLDESSSNISSTIVHDLLVFGVMFFIFKKIGRIF